MTTGCLAAGGRKGKVEMKEEIIKRLKKRIDCLKKSMEQEIEYCGTGIAKEVTEQRYLAKIQEVKNIILEIEEYI